MAARRNWVERNSCVGNFSSKIRCQAPRPPSPDELKTNVFGDEIALTYPHSAVDEGKVYACNFACGTDWYDFYVRLPTYEPEVLNAIQSRLNQLYEKPTPSLKERGLWTVGMPCVALYIRDKKWYRARLEDVAYNMVRFVDYGNPQTCKENDIKPLTRTLAELSAPSVINCTIAESQESSLPSYRSVSTTRMRLMFSGRGEPYEARVPEEILLELDQWGQDAIGIEAMKQLQLPIALQMVKENLQNELIEAGGASRDLTIDDILRTGDAAAPMVEIDVIQPTVVSSRSERILASNVPIPKENADTLSLLSLANEFPSSTAEPTRPNVDRVTVECQTESDFERDLRVRALEEVRKIRANRDDLDLMFKLAMRLGDEKKFGRLLSEA